MRWRVVPSWLCSLFAVLTGLASTGSGQETPTALLARARTQLLQQLDRLPNYTCVQTVHRERYDALLGAKAEGCSEEAAPDAFAPAERPRLLLAWKDRFRLDVSVARGREIFSWAGGGAFQSSDVQAMVGGGLTGTGDFGPFLLSIFGSPVEAFQPLGVEKEKQRRFRVFHYRVSAEASHYEIKTGPKPTDVATLAYEGEVWIDLDSAVLHRVVIRVPRPPKRSGTCRIETTIDYASTALSSGMVSLPALTTLKLWDSEGARHENRIEYASCRSFQTESVLRTDTDAVEAPVVEPGPAKAAALPVWEPGAAVQIAFRTTVDPQSAFAGDPIQGETLTALRAKGGVTVPAGARVQGRIVRLEENLQPSFYTVVGVQFNSVEWNGHPVPLRLQPVVRSKAQRMLTGAVEEREGIGLFVLQTDRRRLDRSFITEWRTAKPQSAGQP